VKNKGLQDAVGITKPHSSSNAMWPRLDCCILSLKRELQVPIEAITRDASQILARIPQAHLPPPLVRYGLATLSPQIHGTETSSIYLFTTESQVLL
jgi:hypothetical protein